MHGRTSKKTMPKALMAGLWAAPLAMAVALSSPCAARAATGDTELLVQGGSSATSAGGQSSTTSSDQARSTVATQSGGGSLAQTGDDTPVVPVALVAGGASLAALGVALRRLPRPLPMAPDDTVELPTVDGGSR